MKIRLEISRVAGWLGAAVTSLIVVAGFAIGHPERNRDFLRGVVALHAIQHHRQR